MKEAVLDAGALPVDEPGAELFIVESTFVVPDAFVLLFDWLNDPSAGNSLGSKTTSLADDTDGALAVVTAGGLGLI